MATSKHTIRAARLQRIRAARLYADAVEALLHDDIYAAPPYAHTARSRAPNDLNEFAAANERGHIIR
jgi:hypothetical protein